MFVDEEVVTIAVWLFHIEGQVDYINNINIYVKLTIYSLLISYPPTDH